ncbi:MAG: hypothetical protein OHK0048_21850 [Rhodoferax sp.]
MHSFRIKRFDRVSGPYTQIVHSGWVGRPMPRWASLGLTEKAVAKAKGDEDDPKWPPHALHAPQAVPQVRPMENLG